MIKIGIDTGVNTGFAVSKNKQLIIVDTTTILNAFDRVSAYLKHSESITVYIEDARKVGGTSSRAFGAGSVTRDAKIWEEFLEKLKAKHCDKLSYHFVKPNKKLTKIPANKFKKITGWQGKTNGHGRDAAMIIYGL